MNVDLVSARLRERIFDAFPVTQPSFFRLLGLLDIEATDTVPTAAVTLGERSRLQINPGFAERMCPTDHDLVMLVLHELHHVALGHTRLFPRVTRAQNWAFDCVINAQLCRLFPQPRWTRLFRTTYRADRFPEALLRPPEGWRTNDERWLPGREGDVHRALYSDISVSYTDLYGLLRQLLLEAGTSAELDALLGNHAQHEADGIAPDVLRELREILAQWPMVDPRSGRDQGGQRSSDTVDKAAVQRQAVAQIRRALLSVAAIGQSGPVQGSREWRAAPSLLPYAPRLARADFLRAALGSPALLHETTLQTPQPAARERTHVYLDVSGSMRGELPVIYAALQPLTAHLHPRVHLFSTEVVDIGLQQLRRGVRTGTGGTDIGPVTQHMLENRVRRAVIITDGWVGDVPGEHARRLKAKRARLAAVVADGGDPSFTQRLACRVWRLPAMENAQ